MGFLKKRMARDKAKTNFVEAPPFPDKIIIETINACNLKCVFCGVPELKEKVVKLDLDLARQIIFDSYAAGAREIGFIGNGDSFLHPDFDKIVAFGKEAGFDYMYVTTNGVLADRATLEKLAENGLHSIRFSINAGDAETYAAIHGRDCFQLVVNNLMAAIDIANQHKREGKNLTKVMVSSVVTPQSELGIMDFQKKIASIVDDFMLITEVNEQGAYRMDYKNECNFLFNLLKISSSGLAIPCCGCGHAMLAIADLNNERVHDAWNNDVARNMRRRFLNGDLSGTLCGVCLKHDEDNVQPLIPGIC
ncbi:radical SAM protein [Desulfovibrio sp. OttesenSCG-928-C06]|nr:radical SAM protein [Desulfovibrio sp. OttesenSCG-928-C06]